MRAHQCWLSTFLSWFPPCAAGASACLLSPCERVAKRVEAALPQGAILADPRVQLVEGLGSQRIQAPGTIGSDLNEAGFLQNAQVSRHAGLVNVHPCNEVVDGLLAGEQGFD